MVLSHRRAGLFGKTTEVINLSYRGLTGWTLELEMKTRYEDTSLVESNRHLIFVLVGIAAQSQDIYTRKFWLRKIPGMKSKLQLKATLTL